MGLICIWICGLICVMFDLARAVKMGRLIEAIVQEIFHQAYAEEQPPIQAGEDP